MNDVIGVVLAAGEGTRMKSTLPKVLHPLCGKPMIGYVVERLMPLSLKKIVVVVGYRGKDVAQYLKEYNKIDIVFQERQLGTGDATREAYSALQGFRGTLLVTCGDSPLLSTETLKSLIDTHKRRSATCTILTSILPEPKSYGRILRDLAGKIVKIVEETDGTPEIREIKEVNSGVYCFDSEKLLSALSQLDCKNLKGEYYLTDVVEILSRRGERIESLRASNSTEIMGVNNPVELSRAEKLIREEILDELMMKGVRIIDVGSTFIDKDVQIGKDTKINPFTEIFGKSQIGERCIIGPQTHIVDSWIGDDVKIFASFIFESRIQSNAKIGPFAHLRPGSMIGDGVKVGNFVEVKKSSISANTKVPHLTYIGDATIGEGVNVGAGTITCNYDGVKKHPTRIEDGVFVGSNVALVAPVNIGKGAVIGAGSTITRDVPPNSLALTRTKQKHIKGWREKKRRRVKENGG
jgi:bifunctional UDP-N-acetylglucosamine pyrophosphorylase/glucosamine-1-phosphate N-acetyltransferase